MSTEKKVYRVLLFYSLIVAFLIFIVELILKRFGFKFTISYIIGAITSALNFLITIKAVNTVTITNKRVKLYLIGSNMLKLTIALIVLYMVFSYYYTYGIFTCFFGFLSVRICIYIRYSIIERIEDNIRDINELYIKEEIKKKLKDNNINKTKELCKLSRNDLLKYLSNREINEIISALKTYELFIKGELEVIKDDDVPNNI